MEPLGEIRDRQILYSNIRADQNWSNALPTENWIVFTIADDLDRELINEAVELCLDKSVCYICCAGRLASLTEDIFDEEIVNRAIQDETRSGKPHDYEYSPMTTSHKNFSDGFWFATTVAHDNYKDIDTVVCLDFTTKGVKDHLIELIIKIKNNWLPSDEPFEDPMYDNINDRK
jgi:hypothetical protein